MTAIRTAGTADAPSSSSSPSAAAVTAATPSLAPASSCDPPTRTTVTFERSAGPRARAAAVAASNPAVTRPGRVGDSTSTSASSPSVPSSNAPKRVDVPRNASAASHRRPGRRVSTAAGATPGGPEAAAFGEEEAPWVRSRRAAGTVPRAARAAR